MSGIISDQTVLDLENARVTGKNNLRTKGVTVSDDIKITPIMNKILDIESYTSFLDEEIDCIYTKTSKKLYKKLQNNSSIKSIIAPNVTELEPEAFMNDLLLGVIILPNVTSIASASGGNSICHNTIAKKIVLPRLVSVGQFGLGWSSQRPLPNTMILADIGSQTQISSSYVSFYNCTNFEYLILRYSSIVSLGATSLFQNTKFSTGGGKAYVPSALVSTYPTETNWSALSGATFITLEGSRFESADWWETVYNTDGSAKNTCTLDGVTKETADNETIAIFKHTENISHCYENGVELADTDLVKGKTLTSTI